MPPEKIYEALGPDGIMAAQGAALSDPERRRIAEFMSGRPLGSARLGAASTMPNQCRDNPKLLNAPSPAQWNGWSSDAANHRFQSTAAAGMRARDVPRLRLKWAFGFPAGVSANAQPTIVAGRVFLGSDNGFFYSLDAASGCVYWSFEVGSTVRGAATVARLTGRASSHYVVYFGDGRANVYARCCGKVASMSISSRASRPVPGTTTASSWCRCPHRKGSAPARPTTRAARLAAAWSHSMRQQDDRSGRRG